MKLLIPPFPDVFLRNSTQIVNDNVDQLPITSFYFQNINVRDGLIIFVKGKGTRWCLERARYPLHLFGHPGRIFDIAFQGLDDRSNQLRRSISQLTITRGGFTILRYISLNESAVPGSIQCVSIITDGNNAESRISDARQIGVVRDNIIAE